MNHPFTEKALRKPRILVAPLNWGLGHATRCIPLIRELIHQQAEVWMAAEGAQEKLLRAEFPAMPVLNLPGYRIEYPKIGGLMPVKMLLQAPRLLKSIDAEHNWLKEKVLEYRFDGIISDNRFGLYNETVPSVFITHQLQVKARFQWMEEILRKRNYSFIEKFSECWIPDNEGSNSLAGILSHPKTKPAIPVHYIGLLSRFKKINVEEKKDHLLCMLSGPEPQRTIFEELVMQQLKSWPHTATVVRGLPGDSTEIQSGTNVTIFNHLPAEKLNQEIAIAEFVIARSGYSSVMDLLLQNKKTILVPTPGQTEQIYLAKSLSEQQKIITSKQRSFSLTEMLERAGKFQYQLNDPGANNIESVIRKFLSGLG